MTADTGTAAKLSPRKQRQMADSFFGPRGVAKTPGPGGASSGLTSSPALLSSSPAFATPMHTLRPYVPPSDTSSKAAILPILLPPATLRPLAFRTFTKKHSLTLTSSALQELATFIGRHCGSGWREEGLAERVLEETAKSWKNRNCGFIVDGASAELKDILKTLESNMSGGRIVPGGSHAKRRGGPDAAGVGGVATAIAAAAALNRPGLNRQDSLSLDNADESEIHSTRLGIRPAVSATGSRPTLLAREDSQMSSGGGKGSELDEMMDDDDDDDNNGMGLDNDDNNNNNNNDGMVDPRRWLKVVGAYDQPRMLYNVTKKHFERDPSKPSFLPDASHKTTVFRNRFHVIHQRLLRNESFQSSAVAEARAVATLQRSTSSSLLQQQSHKITPVANLLGRHGTHHMLLGMLVVLPTGRLSICDLTASIALDLTNAVAIPADSAWFCPGMIVLVDGVYEEEEQQEAAVGRGLNGATGIGGTIGGRFQAFFVGQPPSEKRRVALGISGPDGGPDHTIGGGFGWIDFLGVGSHRAVGARMRKLEQRLVQRQRQQRARQLLEGKDSEIPVSTSTLMDPSTSTLPTRHRVVVLGQVLLDQPQTLEALRKVFSVYSSEPEGATPVVFALLGNFTTHAVLARSNSGGGSIEYKEYFDALAAVLADFPRLLQAATFVFVPGDNDAWVSAFGAGAAVPLPRKPVPDVFTSRVRRTFAAANADSTESERGNEHVVPGEAVWTTNPSRLTLFGPTHEIVLYRDDISARLRRTALRFKAGDAMEEDGGEGEKETETETETEPNIDPDVHTARKLVKTVLDQGYLAPFRQTIRPVHWDYAGALHLYPLPTALVLADTTAPPFCVTYEGCHVMNPGTLLVDGRRGVARWVEYALGRVGRVRESTF